MQHFASPVLRTLFLITLAAFSAACSSSSPSTDSGKGGVAGEAGEGNASGGTDGKGGSSGKGQGGSAGEGGEGASSAADLSCKDGVLNGDETDVDCGGPDCKECSSGKKCEEPSDCQSRVCDDGVCAKAVCGDGVVNRPSEECDDGELNSDTDPDACRTNCKLAGCGDGVIDQEELCDDGNQEDDLTCAADCQAPCSGTAGSCDGDTLSYCAPDGSAVLTKHCDPVQGLVCDAASGTCAGSCAEQLLGPDHTGCDFRATDLRQLVGAIPTYTTQPLRIVLTNATELEAAVTITQGENEVAKFTVPAKSRHMEEAPVVSALRTGTTAMVPAAAYRIRSTQPLSVFQHLGYENGSGDSAALLPVRHWGTDHVVSSAPSPSAEGPAFVTVVAREDDTTVTVNAPVSVTANAEIGIGANGTSTVVLNAEDVLQVTSPSDLTGARITSDKPVEVFGGAGCASVPSGVGYCDHLSEVMPPIPSLGTSHIIVPPRLHEGGERATFVRVVATEADTTLSYSPSIGDGVPTAISEAGGVVELGPLDSAVHITSSSKVLVAQYYPGTMYSPTSLADPSFLVVSPVLAFLKAYDFSVSSGYSDYISVVLPSNEMATLNGTPLDGFTTIADIGFQYVNVPLSGASPHHVECSAGCRVDLLGVAINTSYWHSVGRSFSAY
jgi:hypothetical protein